MAKLNDIFMFRESEKDKKKNDSLTYLISLMSLDK